jgi:hypothetical protein
MWYIFDGDYREEVSKLLKIGLVQLETWYKSFTTPKLLSKQSFYTVEF